MFEQQFFPAGDTLSAAGSDNITGLYYLRKGEVNLKYLDQSSPRKKVSGDYFGEECLIWEASDLQVIRSLSISSVNDFLTRPP